MSDIRLDFYKAINKANLHQPKPIQKKKVVKEEISVEDQIKALLNESESAIIDNDVEFDNSQVVSYVSSIYAKDEKTLLKEKQEEELWEKIEKQREIARQNYRNLNRLQEKATSRAGASTTVAAAASSAAGAGGGSGKPTENGYYQKGYVESGYIV